jgi:hypothetical protein
VLKIPAFAKRQNVVPHCESQRHGQAHLVFADTKANAQKNQKSSPFPTLEEKKGTMTCPEIG